MRTDQAEIAATVHFTVTTLRARHGRKPKETELLAEVMNWKQRRRPPLKERDVALAIRNLAMLGWVDVGASADLPIREDELIAV